MIWLNGTCLRSRYAASNKYSLGLTSTTNRTTMHILDNQIDTVLHVYISHWVQVLGNWPLLLPVKSRFVDNLASLVQSSFAKARSHLQNPLILHLFQSIALGAPTRSPRFVTHFRQSLLTSVIKIKECHIQCMFCWATANL